MKIKERVWESIKDKPADVVLRVIFFGLASIIAVPLALFSPATIPEAIWGGVLFSSVAHWYFFSSQRIKREEAEAEYKARMAFARKERK